MGRRAKEHKTAVLAGRARPFRQSGWVERTRTCRCCKGSFPEHLCLQHIKECWGIVYSDIHDIPDRPPVQAYEFYYFERPWRPTLPAIVDPQVREWIMMGHREIKVIPIIKVGA